MGEEPTLAEIEKIIESYKDTAVNGFNVTGHLLEDKVDKRGADLAYVDSIIEIIKGEHKTYETSYKVTPEKDGRHHKINIKARSVGGTVVHDITINYFATDTEAEEAEKKELEELLEKEDPMVFENQCAKHRILDARIVDKYELAGKLGAVFGYVISLGSTEYAQLMGVRFAVMAEKIFRKKR